jgi:hypothetical protein
MRRAAYSRCQRGISTSVFAGGQRAVHDDDHAGDVEHRHDTEHDVFMADVGPQAAGEDVVLQAAVPVHAALGVAGGAAGVGQHGKVVGAHRGHRRRGGAGQRIAPGGGAGGQRDIGVEPVGPASGQQMVVIGAAAGQHLGQPRDEQVLRGHAGGQPLRAEVGAGDGQHGAAVLDEVLQLRGAVHRVDGHDDGVRAQDGVVGDDELRAVLQADEHAVALPDAARGQPAGQARDLRGQLGIGCRLAQVEQRRPVREAACADKQVVGQGGGGRLDGMRHTGRPERVVRSGHDGGVSGFLATTR